MLYLIHPFVLRAMARVRAGHGGAAWIVMAFLAAQAVAILLHLGVERPVTARLRAALGHRPSATDLAEAQAVIAGDASGGDIPTARS